MKFDTTETGRIFTRECRILARSLGIDLDDLQLIDVLKRAEEMQSGRVRYEQFIEVCHKQLVSV